MDLKPLPVTHQAVIPESYLDEMGHMNVMWYTHLFGRATGGVFRLLGLDRDFLVANRAGTFALAQHFRYLAEVRLGQHVTIRSRLLGRSAKRFHLMHFMTLDESGALAATGEVLGTFVDMNLRRSAPFPAGVAEAIDRLVAEHRLDWDPPSCGAMNP
jgi:acyl-CoA thioester hydrolase